VTGIYNAGFENLSIRAIAEMATQRAQARVNVLPSNDPRSYRVNSDKLLATGFKPQKTVADAIDEICAAYRAGKLKDEERFHNLKWMQKTLFSGTSGAVGAAS
jgi:nucleoside-diphosphate-sugar epimerase